MSSVCLLCSGDYTADGTRHALYSTKCGHLFGKSCLDDWIRRTSHLGRFECPICHKHSYDIDCHPIHDFPKNLLKNEYDDYKDKQLREDEIVHNWLSGRVEKGSTIFTEREKIKINRMFVQFFDVHNEFILIAGHFSYEKTFLRVYRHNEIFYEKLFSYNNFITVALNKFCEESVKICVGFPNGVLEYIELSIHHGVCKKSHENILIYEDSKINSICFLEKKKVVYSVGECNIFSLRTDKDVKENWLRDVNVHMKTVTNLTVKNHHTLLGIINGKIYIFEKNKRPYVVYSEENIKVTNYTYDPVVDMISIVKSSEFQGFGSMYGKNVSHVICSMSKISKNNNDGYRREEYICHPVQDFPDITYHLPQQFKPTLISAKNHHKYFTYSFIPNTLIDTLQVRFVNDSFNLVGNKKIENLDKCIGIFALYKPKVYPSKVVKIPIVLIFGDGFTMLNCYTLI